MATYLVLRDYQDTKRKLPAASLVDDAVYETAEMFAAGLAAIVYNPGTMAVVRERYLAQAATEHGNPDMVALLVSAGIIS